MRALVWRRATQRRRREMNDIMRKRVLRLLETLPDEQLYQVVDYMEFLQSRYARHAAGEPSAFQRFAERIEDSMRLRSVAPRAMRGTMRMVSTASRILDEISDVGRGILEGGAERTDRGSATLATEPVSPEPDAVAGLEDPAGTAVPGPEPAFRQDRENLDPEKLDRETLDRETLDPERPDRDRPSPGRDGSEHADGA